MATPVKVSVLLKNVGELCEGPHWDEASGKLVWMDCMQKLVHVTDVDSGKDQKYQFDNVVGAGVPKEQSRSLVMASGRDFIFLDLETGTREVVAKVDDDRPHNRFNDGKCDPAGRFWAGTRGVQDGEILNRQGRLYSFDCGRSTRAHVDGVTISNGLAWSNDGKTLYYVDSIPRTVSAFDYDVASGNLSNRRVAIQLPPSRGEPDGMTIDKDGMLWIAIWDEGKVVRFDPNTGEELQSVSFPVARTTSCCWAGPNYDELIVTTARIGLTPSQLRDQPLAGSIFRVKNLGTRGSPAVKYHG